jgi:sec-independent protein translocase protein TatA
MNACLAVLGLSGGELVLVLVVILVLFGAKRIPEFAKGLGKGINEFKKASREVTDEIERSVDEPAPPPLAPKSAPTTPTPANPNAPQTPAAPKV